MSSRKRVVVAGMGDTGVLVAGLLARRHDVLAVSTKPMFVSGQELGARLARTADWRRDYLHEFADLRLLDGVDLVHGALSAVEVEARGVVIGEADGIVRRETYDALVIATGTTNGFWRTCEVASRETVEAQLRSAAGRIDGESTVAVVGGGPSGVSVASQIADAHRGVDVTLVHSGDLPLPGYHRRTRRRVVAHLHTQGVRRLPQRRAVVPEGAGASLGSGTITFTSGQAKVAADVIVWATGEVQPSTSFLPPTMLDHAGFVEVEPSLRVRGTDEVFAIGDVAATDPMRSSARNFAHRLLAANVQRMLDGRPEQMRAFRPPRHRWGSITGLQSDGLRIHTPRGRQVRLTPSFTRRVLYPVLTHRLIYGGVRR